MSTTVFSEKTSKVKCARFYFEYKGHPLEDLATFREITLQERADKPMVYFAGDSSLDNKFWVNLADRDPTVAVPDIYHKALDIPQPKPDVAFWLNHVLGDRATALNTAVEESMIRERDNSLLPHDEFIRDKIRPQDTLIISVGGNDIAFKPSFWTIINMLRLAWLTPLSHLEDGSASSLRYFRTLFGDKIQAYVTKLTAITKPRAVIVCMIYYPLESGLDQKSWADLQLTALGYDRWPGQLQAAIRAMYRQATMEIRVDGVEIVPCALYEVLDGKGGGDYTDRVEPNEGGRKMAERFGAILEGLWVDNENIS
ncbi:hypothetical protein T440DRAFT_473090 [Plenodomus tracheiphilus IPT5]|uniref:SGNH hydrolase-type esterase domain-containing protein n=1 Tax=Plenodomus tracheiphilus IPT5 TaxID=1408161 RepID=A0A6A7APZ6_9PLEO|nr:hypothetical protein T440DRAFT_473090 [Plenodomus tracheiphilus IPT5]